MTNNEKDSNDHDSNAHKIGWEKNHTVACVNQPLITSIKETIKESGHREGKKLHWFVHVLPLNVCTKDLMTPKRLVGGDGGEVRLVVCSFAG